MKRRFLILVVLLLISMISMVTVTQSGDSSTRIFVNPSNIIDPTLPQTATTIRPNADGTFGDWTDNTVVLSPNSEGTYNDWTGRILTLNPNDEGTYSQWPAWTHLQPTTEVDQNYTRWAGATGDWDDWPDPDSGVVSASSTSYNNQIETSALTRSPTERRSLTIQKLRVNIVAGYSTASDEQVQIVLSTVYNANVSSFTEAPGWNGWTKTGSNPWLDKEDYPSSYIYSSVTGDRLGNFTFYDIPADIAWKSDPGGVVVRLRIWQNPLGDDAVKIYLYNGTYWKTLTGLTPQAIPDLSYFDYGTQTDIDVYDFLNTRDKINNARIAIEKVTVGDPDTIYIDYACIHLSGVTTPGSYGVTTGLTPSYTTYYSEWSMNPFTDLPWTWSDIDALQAGVKAIQVGSWTGTLRVTQLYVGILTNQGLYTDWDEYPDPTGPNEGDEDLFSATADALSQSSALTDHTSENWPISKVRVTAVASNPDTLDVSSFTEASGWNGWTRMPSGTTGPWLDAADYSANYISTTTVGAKIGNFTFRDVPGGTTACDTVTLSIKTWKSTTGPTLKIYLYDGVSWTSFTVTPPTASPPGSYVHTEVTGFLNTVAKIDAAKMAIERTGTLGTTGVDHVYLSLGDREKIQLMVGIPPFESQANVDGFDNTLTDWITMAGSSPYLDAADYDTNYISTTGNGVQIGDFSFQNVPTGTAWGTVMLRIKTWQSSGGNDELSVYLFDGTSWSSAYTVTPSTTLGYYPDIDVSSFLNSEAKINAARMRLTKVRVGGDDTIYVDHACLYLSRMYYGVETALTTTYTEYTSEWSSSPATGLAWTWAEIDALEAGVRSKVSGLWTGEIRVTQLYVKVIEAETYGHWDDPLPDYNSDADYVSAIAAGLSQSSGLPDSSGWTPARVQVTIVAKTDIPTDEKVRIMLVNGTTGAQYLGSTSFTLTTSYQTYTSVWTFDPATGLAWTWAAINGKEAGVLSVQTGTLWKGEIRVTQLYVVVGRDGTYANWDETSANGDTDYFSSTMAVMRESSQLEDVISPPTWEIGRVRVVMVARTNITTDEQVQLMLVIGGAMYAGATCTPTTSYLTYTADWGKNPRYNIPWNWTAINTLEAGVTSIQAGNEWKGEIRITQLYVEVAGPRFTVNIDVENIVNLYGYNLQLKYDTTVTTATAIIFNYTFFTSQAIQKEEVNDALGYAWLSSQSTAGLKSGNGTLATIIFLVDSTGTTTLDLRVLELWDNLFMDIYWIVGDVDVDRTIDASDLSLLSDVYGSKFGDFNWNEYCDFNTDFKVDVFDLFAQSKNYGKTYAYDGYFSNT